MNVLHPTKKGKMNNSVIKKQSKKKYGRETHLEEKRSGFGESDQIALRLGEEKKQKGPSETKKKKGLVPPGREAP